jgi:hypothetical protein
MSQVFESFIFVRLRQMFAHYFTLRASALPPGVKTDVKFAEG